MNFTQSCLYELCNLTFAAKASTLPPTSATTSVSVEAKHSKDPEKRKSREFPKSRDALVKESEDIIIKAEESVKVEAVPKIEEIAKYDHEPHTIEAHVIAPKEAEVEPIHEAPALKETDILAAMMTIEAKATVQQKGSETVVISLARVGFTLYHF